MYEQRKGGIFMGAGNETIFDINVTSEDEDADVNSIHTPEED
jgi:hypothetical protein